MAFLVMLFGHVVAAHASPIAGDPGRCIVYRQGRGSLLFTVSQPSFIELQLAMFQFILELHFKQHITPLSKFLATCTPAILHNGPSHWASMQNTCIEGG